MQVSWSKPDQLYNKRGWILGDGANTQAKAEGNKSIWVFYETHTSLCLYYLLLSYIRYLFYWFRRHFLFTWPHELRAWPWLQLRDGVNRCSGQCRGSTHSEGECCQGEQTLPSCDVSVNLCFTSWTWWNHFPWHLVFAASNVGLFLLSWAVLWGGLGTCWQNDWWRLKVF